MVGLLTALPQTRLLPPADRRGAIEAESTGNNTEAALNFRPRLDREFLVNGYRELMKELYRPRNYYQRIRTFLENHRPQGPRLQHSWTEFQAFFKSLWLLGFWHRGRLAYWRFCITTLLRRPRLFPAAVELAITGHHFRRVASLL